MNLDKAHIQERNLGLDTVRVLACFLVVLCHVGDNFLIQDSGISLSANIYGTLCRVCVPLFIVISGALLLSQPTPNTFDFLKRRYTRVLVPFLAWSIFYVFLPIPKDLIFGGSINQLASDISNVWLYNLIMIPINFTQSNVHFWFIYTILGLYLLIPILRPWIEKCSAREIGFYLCIWMVSLFYPYIRLYFTEIHGECAWNSVGALYYFSGFAGYLVAGHFLKQCAAWNWGKILMITIPLFTLGFVFTYFMFLYSDAHVDALFKSMTYTINNCVVYPEGNTEQRWKVIEIFYGFLTPNVACMTLSVFMIAQKITFKNRVQKIITDISQKSYGIFLVHYIVVLWACNLWLSPLHQALAFLPTYLHNAALEMPILAIVVFGISYGIIYVLSKLPKSKYFIG